MAVWRRGLVGRRLSDFLDFSDSQILLDSQNLESRLFTSRAHRFACVQGHDSTILRIHDSFPTTASAQAVHPDDRRSSSVAVGAVAEHDPVDSPLPALQIDRSTLPTGSEFAVHVDPLPAAVLKLNLDVADANLLVENFELDRPVGITSSNPDDIPFGTVADHALSDKVPVATRVIRRSTTRNYKQRYR